MQIVIDVAVGRPAMSKLFAVWVRDRRLKPPKKGVEVCRNRSELFFGILAGIMPPEELGFIKIIKTPAGEVPKRIRENWVGLVLPIIDEGCTLHEKGILTEKVKRKSRRNYSLPQSVALFFLQQKSPKVARWFRNHGFPKEGENFTFGADEVEVVAAPL